MNPRKRLCRTEFFCSLQKGGRQISFLITDLEGGGFELQLMRSDAATLSVRLFDVREQAVADAQRELASYLAHGWVIDRDRP